jgi:uncharacterized membrane protein YgdD (TMEM256/DUF423 family)
MHRTVWLGVAALNALVAISVGWIAIFVAFDVPRVNANLLLAAGASFQMVHALAIISLCGLGGRRNNIAWLFFYGILLFSGSLYMRALGAGPPVLILSVLGALLLALGWLALAWSSLTSPRA